MKTYDTIIIGSGPSGYSAAIYTSRANLSTLVLSGDVPGGQLTTTTEVENYAGFSEGINGPKLMEEMKIQALRFNTEFKFEIVESFEKDGDLFTVRGKDEYQCKSIIISSGASAKWLNSKGEEEYKNRGVSACATCDGALFSDKPILVVGGGDTAMEEALFLSRLTDNVTLINRSEKFKASKIMLDRVNGNKNITILPNTEIVEISGGDLVEKVEIINNKTNEKSMLDISAVFIAIGHKPNSGFINKDLVDIDSEGYIATKNIVFTKTNGIFACGDIVDKVYRQAIIAAGDGARAALEVEKYLSENS